MMVFVAYVLICFLGVDETHDDVRFDVGHETHREVFVAGFCYKLPSRTACFASFADDNIQPRPLAGSSGRGNINVNVGFGPCFDNTHPRPVKKKSSSAHAFVLVKGLPVGRELVLRCNHACRKDRKQYQYYSFHSHKNK